MHSQSPSVNMAGDFEESIVQFARYLGTNSIRRKLFNAVYGPGSKPKSKRQLMQLAEIQDVGAMAQQAQNELHYLHIHHLIVRLKNDGQVDDGSRYVYLKDDTVRAHRKRILRLADNPKRANSIPTKRSPRVSAGKPVKRVSASSLSKRNKLTVLFLTSSPEPKNRVRVDYEFRLVQEAIRSSKFRDNVLLKHEPAADLKSIVRGLNDDRPQIVHFSGHSNSSGIAVDNQSISQPKSVDLSYELFARALKSTDYVPKIVVFNSCDSSISSQPLLEVVDVLVAMNKPITDLAAATFAPQFYAALASGQSVRSAFEQACVVVEGVSLGERHTPALFLGPGVDASKIKLS